MPHSPFDGDLYDVRVWKCARTASEISSFRYATLQGNEPGLVALSGCEQVNPLPMPMSSTRSTTSRPRCRAGRGGPGPAGTAAAGAVAGVDV